MYTSRCQDKFTPSTAALFSVEEAARIPRESVPNGGGVIKEHDGSVSEGLASYQGHFPVDDRAFEFLPSAKVRREKTPPWRQEHKRRRVRSSTRTDGQERTGRSTRLKRRSTLVARPAGAMMQASVVTGLVMSWAFLVVQGFEHHELRRATQKSSTRGSVSVKSRHEPVPRAPCQCRGTSFTNPASLLLVFLWCAPSFSSLFCRFSVLVSRVLSRSRGCAAATSAIRGFSLCG